MACFGGARWFGVAWLSVGMAIGGAAPAWGVVYSPRVTSEHVADCSSLEAFSNFPAWKDLKGQERALAVWKYFVSTETGVFHYNPIQEGLDPVLWEYRLIRDPIKMMNVYGYGFCGLFGPTTAGLFEGVGFEKVRAVGIPGAAHSVTEVWYDNDWHYYDTDLRGVIFRRDGKTVASIQDLLDDPTLLTDPSKKFDPFFPGDRNDPSQYAKSYKEKPVNYVYRWHMGGSTMDYVLRKGESLTRWWQPQGGRWAFNKDDAGNDFWKNLIKKEPYGAKGNHPEFSVWTHGNGLFDYQPALRKGSKDFEDGVFEQKNVELTEKGIVAKDGGGEVVWEVLSPYVIVPQVNSIDTTEDDKEASVITFRSGGGVKVALSLDYGRSYNEIQAADKTGETTIDLTPYLKSGRYQYLVKFTLAGGEKPTAIKSLRIRTWVQVAPASLPRLKKGLNHLQYATGDKSGQNTVPWMQIPNMGDAAEMARYWSEKPKDYDPKRTTQRLKGEGEIVFTAPPGRLIQWMSLGGFFNAYQEKEAPKTRNEIWYAMDDSQDWMMAYRANVPDWHQHWHYAFDKEVPLLRPAKKVRVKYIGNPGVNGIRVNLHSVRAEEKPDTAVVVTHAFKMGGKLQEKRVSLDGPKGYTIDCAAEPEDVSIRVEVPSDRP